MTKPKALDVLVRGKPAISPASVEVLRKLESLTGELLRYIDSQNRLIERLHSDLIQAQRRMEGLEEANLLLEEKLKEIVERMESGLDEWARQESARRRMFLLRESRESPKR